MSTTVDTGIRMATDAGKGGRANGTEVPMTRRRFQRGSIFRRGKRVRTWVARWREDVLLPDGSLGRIRRSEVLGLVREIPTKRQALALLEEHLRSVNQGTHKPSSVLTFRQFALEKWEPSLLPTFKHSTQRDYRSLLRRHLLPAFGHERLCDIERADVQLFLTEKGKHFATSSVHHLRVLLSRILGVAMEWGYLHENTARGTKLARRTRTRERPFLTAEQARRLIAVLSGVIKTLASVALLTGLRRCELFGLRWKHLDFDRRVIRVRESLYEGKFTLPKTKSSVRDIPMSNGLCALLVEHRRTVATTQPDELVFANECGLPLNPQRLLREALYPACDRLGLPRIGWHAFRHTHATLLSDGGEPLKLAQAQLGHSDLATTLQVYTHVVPESQRRAVAKLDRLLDPNGPNFTAGSELTH